MILKIIITPHPTKTTRDLQLTCLKKIKFSITYPNEVVMKWLQVAFTGGLFFKKNCVQPLFMNRTVLYSETLSWSHGAALDCDQSFLCCIKLL